MPNLLRYTTATAGASGYVEPQTAWTGAASGDWAVIVCFSVSSYSGTPRILGISGSTSTRIVVVNTNGGISWITVGIVSANNVIPLNTKVWVRAESVGATKNLYYSLDGVNFTLAGTANYSASAFAFNRIGSSATFYSPVFDFYSLEFVGGTYSDKWDATTAPSTGTTWPSVAGTRNIRLMNFTGTADSWWMFYADGGDIPFAGNILRGTLSLVAKNLNLQSGYNSTILASALNISSKNEAVLAGYVNTLSKQAYLLETKQLSVEAGNSVPFITNLLKSSLSLTGKQLSVSSGWSSAASNTTLLLNTQQESVLAGFNTNLQEVKLNLVGKGLSLSTGTSISFVGEVGKSTYLAQMNQLIVTNGVNIPFTGNLSKSNYTLRGNQLSLMAGVNIPFVGDVRKLSLNLTGKTLSALRGQVLEIQKQSLHLVAKQLSLGEVVYPIIPVERLFFMEDRGRYFLMKQNTTIFIMKH